MSSLLCIKASPRRSAFPQDRPPNLLIKKLTDVTRAVWLAFGLAVLSSASASAQQDVQWQLINKTFFDLISEGYELKSLVSNEAASRMLDRPIYIIYFLQKQTSLVRCLEYLPENAQAWATEPGRCQVLVAPK
jgi:hypothetical protein